MEIIITCVDKKTDKEIEIDFNKTPAILFRSRKEDAVWKLLGDTPGFYKREVAVHWRITAKRIEQNGYNRISAVDAAYGDPKKRRRKIEPFEAFSAPWLDKDIVGKTAAEIAPRIPVGMAEAVKAFAPNKSLQQLVIQLPWLDGIWTPELKAALEELLPLRMELAKRRVFFLLGASRKLHHPMLESLPQFNAEVLTIPDAFDVFDD